ncbi:male sterility protein-domain-containing protein, partial [Boeremia exigua]|uniref:male sterility protein-domain-containing protein n=1 Tax=Boeremia exigua TaxID=749465 RepID=UPI001E8DD820
NNTLGQRTILKYSDIALRSVHMHSLRTTVTKEDMSVEDTMQELLLKYSNFKSVSKRTVVLTGTTELLGAHVLAQLVARTDVETVYCLVRADDNQDAARKVTQSLIQRKVYHSLSLKARAKISALHSDFSDAYLGLPTATYTTITQKVTNIIHCEWAVNLKLDLQYFEKVYIAGLNHLINLCLASLTPGHATFDFCSCVSTVARCSSKVAPEEVAHLDWAQDTGYAQSKCVAEQLCEAAAQKKGIKARVLRVDQIVADTVHGVWNKYEAIPLMIQSALTVGVLPRLQEFPSWTPVDIVARAITEISLSDAGAIVANIAKAKKFSWTDEILPALRQARLKFDEVEPQEWVARLRKSSDDVGAAFKLVNFLASEYDQTNFGSPMTYETAVACQWSPTLHHTSLLDASFVKTFVDQFMSSVWKQPSTAIAEKKKQVIVVAGPCGSGKSTVAKHLSITLKAPFIEGDELHSRSAVEKMASGTPLDDDDRAPWLNRLNKRALETINDLGYEMAIVSCSALKKQYRNNFRVLEQHHVRVIFLDLQAEKDELVRRVQNRGSHFMKSRMVTSQLAIYSAPSEDEVDVLPIDAGKCIAEVIEEVEALLKMVDI